MTIRKKMLVVPALLACLFTAQGAAAEDLNMSFPEIADGLEPVANTALSIKTSWQGWHGGRVMWTGKVVEIKVGRTRQEIYIADENRPVYRGYNVVLSISDYNRVALLKKGQTVQFKGNLKRYTARRGRPVVVTLDRGELIGVSEPEPAAPPMATPDPPVSPAPPAATGEPLAFGPFVDLIDPQKQTKLAARTNWANLKVKQVTWTGTVVEVKAGRGRAEVFVASADKPLYRGYNIIIKTYDVHNAGLLKKGGTVQFSGAPTRYTSRRGVPVVVTLSHGQILAP